MACNDKTGQRCNKVFGACVSYEKELPTFSQIENDCPSIEEVGEDLYNLVGEIKEEIDLSSLRRECITFPTERTVLSVMQALIDKICAQQTEINSLEEGLSEAQSVIQSLLENNCP